MALLPKAGRPCTICTSPLRARIETLIAKGEPIPKIVRAFPSISLHAVYRHINAGHLALRVAEEKAAQAAERTAVRDERIAEKLEFSRFERLTKIADGLLTKAVSLLNAAEQAGDLRGALAGVREARETLMGLARLEGLLDGPPVNVNVGIAAGDGGDASVRIVLPFKPGGPASGDERLFDPSGATQIGRVLADGRYELFGGIIDPTAGSGGGGALVVLPANGRESSYARDGDGDHAGR